MLLGPYSIGIYSQIQVTGAFFEVTAFWNLCLWQLKKKLPEAKLCLLVVKEPPPTPQWLLLTAEPPRFQPPKGSSFPPLHQVLNCELASWSFPFHRLSRPLFKGTTTISQYQPDEVRGFHLLCVFISTLLSLLPLWVFFFFRVCICLGSNSSRHVD